MSFASHLVKAVLGDALHPRPEEFHLNGRIHLTARHPLTRYASFVRASTGLVGGQVIAGEFAKRTRFTLEDLGQILSGMPMVDASVPEADRKALIALTSEVVRIAETYVAFMDTHLEGILQEALFAKLAELNQQEPGSHPLQGLPLTREVEGEEGDETREFPFHALDILLAPRGGAFNVLSGMVVHYGFGINTQPYAIDFAVLNAEDDQDTLATAKAILEFRNQYVDKVTLEYLEAQVEKAIHRLKEEGHDIAPRPAPAATTTAPSTQEDGSTIGESSFPVSEAANDAADGAEATADDQDASEASQEASGDDLGIPPVELRD